MCFGQCFKWVTICKAIKFILPYDGCNHSIKWLQMWFMCWKMDIKYRNDHFLTNANYWSSWPCFWPSSSWIHLTGHLDLAMLRVSPQTTSCCYPLCTAACKVRVLMLCPRLPPPYYTRFCLGANTPAAMRSICTLILVKVSLATGPSINSANVLWSVL